MNPEIKTTKIKVKNRIPWDNRSTLSPALTEKKQLLLDKIETINLKLLDIECERDCLLKKKKHYLELLI